ncbi:MAG: aminoglycoside 3'-phosphotransferase [Clostridia bacterium]|nr:aminoglycoside 3'-phosphotransferase [Clostridia bacterium]
MTAMKKFPKAIAEKIGNLPYQTDDIGRSDSAVLLFEDMVLKIEKTGTVSDREYAILQWLDGKLPTPRILAFEHADGYNYLLMTKLQGTMACEQTQPPESIVKGLAAGLKMLWSVDISDCPHTETFADKLAQAKKRLSDKNDLSKWQHLYENRPEETLVFSHGDYCLPNIFLNGEIPVGFLDLGSAGVRDLWYDIHWCLWSMEYNFCEFFGMSKEKCLRYRELLFEELGMSPDEERLRYHGLLDEFFE